MKSINSIIAGINPFSCNDYPKEISYVIFLGGCNFRCPFCHNSSIVNFNNKISLEIILNDLKRRKNFIKAVVITGGEPTIHSNNLIQLLKIIKQMNFKIKLDTNGTNPVLLKKIINLKLVDYIAMDVKNTFDKYNQTTNTKVNIEDIKKSIKIIEPSRIKYEFRTTINKSLHTKKDIEKIKTYFKSPKRYFLQNYQYNKEQIINKDFGKFSTNKLNELSNNLEIKVKI